MPTTPARYTGAVIVASDRVYEKQRDNISGDLAAHLLSHHDVHVFRTEVIPEGQEPLRQLLRACVDDGIDVMAVVGSTGVGVGNYTPEISAELIDARLYGMEAQVLLEGLKNSPKAGLCRGIIGLTQHGGGSLIINSASSKGGVKDALGVVLPLLGDIFWHCS